MPDRVPLPTSPDEQAEDERFRRLYGPWDPLTPAQVARELAGFDQPWWVVGGWAIEAATGDRREHEDTDVSILARDVPAFVRHLSGRWHVWSNVGGVLRPLGERWPDVSEPDSQLWWRRDATSPWVLDVPLTPDRDGRWTSKRWPEHVAEVADVTWVGGDGIRYLRPEVVLHYKARLHRPKDDHDLDVTVDTLAPDRRAWLRRALHATEPGHRWLSRV